MSNTRTSGAPGVSRLNADRDPVQHVCYRADEEDHQAVTGGALAPLTGARTTLRLHGETKDVALFDWFELLQQGDADENEFADEIMNNQIDVERIPDVETFAWIPFGIVSMTGELETYDEMGVEGTLYLRLDLAEGGDAPVVLDGGRPPDDQADRPLRFQALWQTLEKR
jgi:hypothetical protein